MAREINIATAHSRRENESLKLELTGGDPWFVYLWLDDVCYCLSKRDTERKWKLRKVD